MIIKSVKMLFSAIGVCISVLGSVELKETGPMEITFKVQSVNNNELVCDHDIDTLKNHKYTVLEGEKTKLKIDHPSFINSLSCSSNNKERKVFLLNPKGTRHITEFQVRKDMGDIWKCTILSNRDVGIIGKVVKYENNTYAAVYCHMQIHVRQQSSPQTILVNNMALDLVRTDLSEKDIDFTAVYEYADNDIVSVTCTNFLKKVQRGQLSLEYKYADQFSGCDKYSCDPRTLESFLNLESQQINTNSYIFKSSNLSSSDRLGFRAKLHSIHNNTEIICIYKESNDLTKIMVRLMMRNEFDNYVRVTIDGMIIRPKRKKHYAKHYYSIDYKYFSDQTFVLVCEVVNDYTKLFIPNGQDKVFVKRKVNDTRAEVSLRHDAKMTCGAKFKNNGYHAETVELTFTAVDIIFDLCSLNSDLPSNGTVMELYEFQKRKVIYYEFEEGETLSLTCYSGCVGPIVYLQLDGTGTLENNKENISKTRILTRKDENTVSNCTLIEVEPDAPQKVIRELKVIFLKKSVRTTVTSTTEPSRESYTLAVPTNPEADKGPFHPNIAPTMEWMIPVVGGVTFIVIVCVVTVIFKMKKRDHSQRPHDPTYENTNASIPPHPPQWEQAYAVPVDGRLENETYSVPYKPEGAVYSVPLPKSERNKKKNNDPNYATLDVKKSTSRQNLFNDTDDPNYSEICYNKKQIYAQVLPKNKRIKQDDNPYSYVTKEGAYVITNRAEPLYCDPNKELKSQKKEYVNVSNNHHYANSSGQEYVEPTYCEPNKQ